MSDYFRFKSESSFNFPKKSKRRKHLFKKIIIIAILGFTIYLILYNLFSYMSFDSLFMVKKVRVLNVNIVEDSFFDSIRSEVGRNLLDFNDSIYKKKLLENPWIQDVNISKHYPNRIKVKIKEKTPILLWHEKEMKKWYGVTKSGSKIAWPQNSVSLPNLPIIEKIQNLDTIEFYHLVSFLEQINDFNNMLYSQISQIVIHRVDEVKIWVNGYPIWFVFALDADYSKVFSLWESLLQKSSSFFKKYDYLDLRVSGYGYLK